MRPTRVALIGVIAAALGAIAAPAAADVQPYGTNDLGGFRDVLPPGTNGLVNPVQLAAYEANNNLRPPHNNDQVAMYRSLPFAAPISETQIPGFFKDATFGVRPGAVDGPRTESPLPGATIIRDKQFGVPHIYGNTRPELMFAIGYASAEDRLFFMDALRHVGRAEVSSFAGGSNRSVDEFQWQVAPYTEQDLQRQFDGLAQLGPVGAQVHADILNYVAGVNAYIAKAKLNLLMLPGEYPALVKLGGPAPFTPADLVAIASLVGAQFGNGGGGDQLGQALLLQSFQRRFGARRGRSYWADFAGTNDPEAPTTVHHRSFPYDLKPRHVNARSLAMPDPGTVIPEHTVSASADAGTAAGLASRAPLTLPVMLKGRQMSNALLVSGAHTASGHPIAVMGPQVSYFSPEILMEEDIHGPGIDAAGAAFPGVNTYVQLGHGRDYAWSTTSADQDIVDTFAVPLCNPNGGSVSLHSMYYRLRGSCLPMERLVRHISWTPNLADSTPAGSETLTTFRTRLGLLIARALVHHRPVGYVQERSTYFHELDSSVGVERLNDPGFVHDARSWEHAVSAIKYAFNWFYADSRQIAFFNSGANPVRAPGVDPRLPTAASFPWRGFDPATNTASYTRFSQHAKVIDQDYLTSWNNKSAPGDGLIGTPIYRSVMLDDGMRARLRAGRKMTLADLINVMANAATTDLRGDRILPYLLRVLGRPRNPAVRAAIRELRAWLAGGAQRRSPVPGQPYQHAGAIRIMDAWWPRLVAAIYEPAMGPALYEQVKSGYGIDNVPNGGDGIGDGAVGTSPGMHPGSAWDGFFYGYVQKDLREVLGLRVRARYHRVWCGGGSLRRCRAALRATLAQAAAVPVRRVYPADGTCPAGDQACWDQISFASAGAVGQPPMPWQNRPTFQEAVEVLGHQPR